MPRDYRSPLLSPPPSSKSLEELVQLHRTTLTALPAHAPGLARGRLHLAIGATLAGLGLEYAEEATEELRQALDLLGEEEAPLEHAEARHRLGALLLPLRPDPSAGGRVGDAVRHVGDAVRHLERAHRAFEELDQPAPRVATSLLLAVALVDLGKPSAGRALLELERDRTEGELRSWVEASLLCWYLDDPEPARRAEGQGMLARYLAGGCAATQGTDDQIMALLAVQGTRLPRDLQELALAWLEARPDAPLITVGALRRTTRRGDDRWLRPEERARLEAQFEDARAPLRERCHAAYTLLGSLPPDERRLRSRAIERLEGWLDAPELDPLQRACFRHDLAVAMQQVGPDDPAMLRRAARHLEKAIPSLPPRDRPDARQNLALILLGALRSEAEVSSPALLELAGWLDDLAKARPPEEAAELRLEAASHLLHWGALTHPDCLEAARELIQQVIAADPLNPHAWRMRAFCTWIRHCQGRASAADVEQARARARDLGPVPEFKPPRELSDEQHRAIASAVAGTRPLEGIDPEALVELAPLRPDVVDPLLDELERRLTLPGVGDAERGQLLEAAVNAVVSAAGREEGQRGRRLADLFKLCAPHLPAAELRRYQAMVRGPAAEALAAALGAIPPEAPAEESAGIAQQDLAARVEDLHRRGIDWLDKGRRLSRGDAAQASACFRKAMDLLDQARVLASGAPQPRRALIHASAGNARRALASFDKDRADALLTEAEALYREALPWTRESSRERALVSKVLADCLIDRMARGGADRWDEAMTLYGAALEGRPGGFERWETLLSVARTELEAPGRPKMASQKAALARIEEALEHVAPDDRERGTVTARLMLDPLSALSRRGQLDPGEADRIARRIGAACPELARSARLAAMGLGITAEPLKAQYELFSSRFVTTLSRMLKPILQPLTLESVPPELRAVVQEAARSGRIQLDMNRSGDIEGLRAEVARLRVPAPGEEEEERAARLVARARILRHLLDLGQDVLADHAAACAEAEQAVRALASPGLRAFGLCDLSKAWQQGGPGGDFARAARLLEEALALCRPEWVHLRADIVGAHAHATRFRPDLPGHVAVARAIDGYQAALALYLEAGAPDGAAEALQNLAEATDAREDLPRLIKLQKVIEVERQAIGIARVLGDARLGPLLGNLAWSLTQLADAGVSAEERRRHLTEAGPLYEEALRITRDLAALHRIQGNQLTWRSIVEPDSAGEALRSRLRSLDKVTQPREWALTAHNLAGLCARGAHVSDLREALALYREALPLRPLDADPRFHWETAQSLGELLAQRYTVGDRTSLAPLGLTEQSARREAAACFRSALRAARSLGPGSKLAQSARCLGLLAADVTPGATPNLDMASEAMLALEEVLGLAPEDRDAGDTEAEVAAAVAGALAACRASTALIVAVTATDTHGLHGAAAWEVLHWMLRARGGQHRRLRARMARPASVLPEVWTRWRMALRGQENWAERRAAAAAVRAEAPSFLGAAPDLSATTTWMQATRGAAATLLLTPFGWLLGVLTPRGDQADAVVLLLRAEPLELELSDIVTRLRAPAELDGRAAEAALEVAKKTLGDLKRWFRRQVLPALRARLPADLESLLWSPHGAAAALPLGLVCEDIPSIWTTPCITLPPPPPGRPIPSALLVLADPETSASAGAIPSGPEAIAAMARALAPHVPRLEVLLGCGGARGAAVAAGLDVPGLLPDAAPTPGEIRRRISDHRLVFVLAHGQYDAESPERSSLVLLDEQGRPAPLSAGDLAESPDLLRGATVVLLACELGQGGARLAAPEGLAGVLIAVGASAVIAPLWPVLSDGALRVGEWLARAVTIGIDLGRALQTVTQLVRSEVGEDPGEAGLYGLGPFIAWTG